MRTRLTVSLLLALAGAWLAACGSSGEATSPPNDAAVADATVEAAQSRPTDGGTSPTDASDASVVTDSSDGSDAATYHSFTAANWSAFDVTMAHPEASGFWGGAFDGRYVYFVPSHNATSWNGIVTRYDTQGGFASGSSWSTFDTGALDANIAGYYGAVFDGRYVYFIPPASGPGKIIARYDTQAAFGTAASWSKFDTTTVNANAKGFIGGTFDGRYLYLAPYYNGYYSGLVTRYDTTASFTNAASWESFDAKTVNAKAVAFYGAVFDGRHVYFIPDSNGQSGTIARYDTQAAFGTAASWSTFDITTVDAKAKGFRTGAFDGRYLYLAPNGGSFSTHGVVARLDTQAAFTAAASWSTFDATTVSAQALGFFGASFDGRYITFAPHDTSTGLRYDTQAAFGTASSWGTLDLTPVSAKGSGFQGSVFDGRFVYLVPAYGGGGYSGTVLRFDAKSSPSMPKLPGFSGSFF